MSPCVKKGDRKMGGVVLRHRLVWCMWPASIPKNTNINKIKKILCLMFLCF